MALEQIAEPRLIMEPAPFDAHVHPRIFDALTKDYFTEVNDGEGKAGLRAFSEAALLSGFGGMIAMPNETARLYDPLAAERTRLEPFPIANRDRVTAAQSLITQESYIPTGLFFGLDPADMFVDSDTKEAIDEAKLHNRFSENASECAGLKIYGDETTGGYNVYPRHVPRIVELWHSLVPDRPVVLHLEDDNIGKVLAEIAKLQNGKDIPIHIAHVSSREELEAVIAAKKDGMNVTCEVTVHHLFLDASVKEEIGGYASMKPSLKSPLDISFIWGHLDSVDIIASDCAPHRRSDKEAEKPAYGVTTHALILPLLLGAAAEGRITHQQIDEKLCTNPRRRFNFPINDGSSLELDISDSTDWMTAVDREHTANTRYGYNPFVKCSGEFRLLGNIVRVEAGRSLANQNTVRLENSYTHFLRPD